MAQTVVGMFDNSTEAQQAVAALVSQGISRDRIDVSGNTDSSYSSGTESSHSSSDRSDSHDHENGITRFFKNLFGDSDDDADKYSRVASRSQSIVTVHAQSNDEAERAADILDDNGAVDVDEKATQYGYSGGTGYSSGAGNTRGNSFGDTSNTVGAFDTGTATGGLSGTASTAGDFEGDRVSLSGNDRSDDLSSGVTGSNRTGLSGNDTTGYLGSDRTGFTDSDRTGLSDNDRSHDDSKKIQIIEENLEVGKREVNRGSVRLRSRIVERPVEESIRLREERVNVQRNAVDRPATDADFSNFEERDIEMVERAEVPVVNKQARVVEEVSLNKEVEERNETVSDTVRKTEVDVDNDTDNLDNDNLRTGRRNDF
jgi:uncharacterized protein (TIGR02271 family)